MKIDLDDINYLEEDTTDKPPRPPQKNLYHNTLLKSKLTNLDREDKEDE